ncbi:ABC transporter ATP-binding protein [Devosia sp. 63-57]|uniref:ABC transporter ATP-binding protein n=1 Tax=Devosia sp. 63-57 TaxID=1895751 RepID=UPI00086A8D7D|nr:ABC transporter ATP-binding protein [Devosia sp. 63-57]ODT47282.1 MAG: ABC transporter ATP-binding protein [Pelagibacterium sp. SCN 63-126]ODU84679.1 MAG: ABC transporter ATP-binding protein [Pelagibacterium sp. SCN 63-17]OJX43010.1 MAG: ABC transporter ATP-binding protein [Devosia sp. 63-57]
MSTLLDIRDVSKSFRMGGLFGRKTVNAVMDASFSLSMENPEIFTVIGESGSGKTTLARMILGLEDPTEGEILFRGQKVDRKAGRAERLKFMANVQPVFQNPFEAFNPLKKIERYLESTARRFLDTSDKAVIDRAMDEALQKVGLSLKEVRGRFPHEMSGGQLQRAAIARALIPNPPLLVADEPVSMVDASLRMSIVNLLKSLRDDLKVSVIYITHDLATAYYISNRLIIMQRGRIVEMGDARTVLDNPQHPYSRLLKASVLSTDDAGDGKLKTDPEMVRLAAESVGREGRLVDRPDGRSVRVYEGA